MCPSAISSSPPERRRNPVNRSMYRRSAKAIEIRKNDMRHDDAVLAPRADGAANPMPRTLAALLAGAVAIALNIAALAAADLVPLATAHGGLLRLLMMLSGDALQIPAGSAFQAGFHIVVGLPLALSYAFVFEPMRRGPTWPRG